MALRAGYYGVKRKIWEAIQTTVAKSEQDITDIWSSYAKTGSVNHLPNILTSQTKSGVTVTVDDNKVVTLDTDGSATAAAVSFVLYEGKGSDLQWLNGKYLSGCLDGSDTTYIIRVGYNESPWTALVVNKTEPVLISGIPNTTAKIAVSIYIYSGTTLDNVKLFPMVADSLNAPYAPYAMTNQQLTVDKLNIVPTTLTNSDDTDLVFDDGWYTWNGSSIPAHWASNSWAVMRVITAIGAKLQIGFTQNEIYTRRYGGSPQSWGNWYKFTGTAVSQAKAPEDIAVDPEISEDEPVVIKKSTRKTTTKKTEEEE